MTRTYSEPKIDISDFWEKESISQQDYFNIMKCHKLSVDCEKFTNDSQIEIKDQEKIEKNEITGQKENDCTVKQSYNSPNNKHYHNSVFNNLNCTSFNNNININKKIELDKDSEILDSPYNNIFFQEFTKLINKYFTENGKIKSTSANTSNKSSSNSITNIARKQSDEKEKEKDKTHSNKDNKNESFLIKV